MKIIDLLNKIANGEEVPEKIKYRNKIFIYDKDNQCYVVENYNEYYDLHMSLSNHKGTDLLYEVEIIEEKEIPQKIPEDVFEDYTKTGKVYQLYKLTNDIIDYLKSKGDE